jgi:hypothetical protein
MGDRVEFRQEGPVHVLPTPSIWASLRRHVGSASALATLAGNAWWTIGALTWTVVTWALPLREKQPRHRTATLLAVAAAQLTLYAILVSRSGKRFTPNYEWEPDTGLGIEVMFQPPFDLKGGTRDGPPTRLYRPASPCGPEGVR